MQMRKLIAAEARQRVTAAKTPVQPIRNGLQQAIAHRVTERVIDVLEPVQIQVEQRKLARVALGKADRLVQPVVEQQAVRQAGEAVVMRHALDALLRQHLFRNVGRHGKTAQDLPLVPDMRHQLHLDACAFAENAAIF